MKILAFDTSGKACSVALCNGKKEKALHKIVPMQQASLILPMIDDLLAEFSLTTNQLDAIAYGCGPGSFTGIRIASCVA
jgi:tRNA threonylcarbamoyladenosine biosynthesis protein TsaB